MTIQILITGQQGEGKTKIAKKIYDLLSSEFETSMFDDGGAIGPSIDQADVVIITRQEAQ